MDIIGNKRKRQSDCPDCTDHTTKEILLDERSGVGFSVSVFGAKNQLSETNISLDVKQLSVNIAPKSVLSDDPITKPILLDSDQLVDRGVVVRNKKAKKTKNRFTVRLRSNDSDYESAHKFICERYIELNKGTDRIKELMVTYVETGEHPKIHYKLPEGKEITIRYNDSDITAKIVRISKDHGTASSVVYISELIICASSKETIDGLLFEACHEPETLLIYTYDAAQSYWKKYGKVQRRDEGTLIINENEKTKLLTDIMKFVKAEKEYDKFGIPYKRNYLFHGKPGTGKSSLVNIIANKTNRSIYIIPFSSELTDAGLFSAINGINNESAILLLEDIDCIFQNREKSNDESHVSFSALLNILDGVTRVKSLITIITTNYVKKLDSALIRPGRVDMMIEFSIISTEQINGLLKLYTIELDDKEFKKLEKICKSQDLTPSVLSSFMFRNRDVELNNSNYITQFKKYLKEIEMTLPNKNYQELYL